MELITTHVKESVIELAVKKFNTNKHLKDDAYSVEDATIYALEEYGIASDMKYSELNKFVCEVYEKC